MRQMDVFHCKSTGTTAKELLERKTENHFIFSLHRRFQLHAMTSRSNTPPEEATLNLKE